MDMTQVKEIANEGLKRAYAMTAPQGEVEKALLAHLEEAGRGANMPGFRPGKIPMTVLRQRFGESARKEVVNKVITQAIDETLAARSLRSAMQPKVEIVVDQEGKDLEFKVSLEILPDVTPKEFTSLALERFTADVDEAAVDNAIMLAARDARKPEPLAEDRPAQMGDVAVIDFDGTVDGKSQPGMKGQGHALELGSHSFIDTFEEQLVGTRPGDKKNVTVTFPADYHAADLAGKKAEFAVEVKALQQVKPVELNDATAKMLGFSKLESLRTSVRNEIGGHYKNVSRAVIKRQMMDQLAAAYDFAVPESMVEAEFGVIWRQVQQARIEGSLPDSDAAKSEDDLRKEYRSLAERRVRLGLLLAEVAKRQSLSVGEKELRNALINEARRFPGQEKAVIDYYTQTPGAVERLRAPLLEEKVVDYILTQAKITDTKVEADKLVRMPEEME